MNIHYTTQFKRDYKRIKKQNRDIDLLKVVIEKLVAGEKLEPKYRDHQLLGNWKGHRDCHIESDWILIYRIEDEDLILERTGSHSDLFKKYPAITVSIKRNTYSGKKEKEMELFLIKYINKMLKKANYEYDSATNSWCASVDKLPGVYAQADTIEDARSELAEIIEEYVFVSLQEGHPLPGFKNFRKVA